MAAAKAKAGPRPPGALWIGAYADGTVRHNTGRDTRSRSKLPALDWLRERLAHIGGPGFDMRSLSALGGGAQNFSLASPGTSIIPIVGLARIGSSKSAHAAGPLAEWGEEADLLRMYYGDPLDAYSVGVEEVRQCAAVEHLTCRHKSAHHYVRVEGGLGRISSLRPLFIGAWGNRAGDVCLRPEGCGRVCFEGGDFQGEQDIVLPASTSAASVLQEWGMNANADDIPVLLLPFPIALLACHQQWRKLLVLARWHPQINLEHDCRTKATKLHGPIAAWPPSESPVWEHVGRNLEEHWRLAETPLTASSLATIASELRRWAPAILSAQEPENVAGERQALEECVGRLQSWSTSLLEVSGVLHKSRQASKFRHDSKQLIECLRFSRYLSGGADHLVAALERALALSLPPALVGEFLRAANESVSAIRKFGATL